MANTDRLSEFAKLYYIIGEQDLSGGDVAILGLAWVELCVISVSPSSNVNNFEVKDRCVGQTTGNAPGRRTYTFDTTLNMFRQNPDFALKAWNTAMDDGSTVAFLIYNDDISEAEAWGTAGNYVRIDESEDQPEEGLITVSYTFGPAARAAQPLVTRVYGSSVV